MTTGLIFFGYDKIRDVISRDSFELIVRHLHFVDNMDESVDKGYRIWKFFFLSLKIFELIFGRLKTEEHQSIDEICIPYKGSRSTLRQYNPNKLGTWVFKLWGRAGTSGYLYDFDVCGVKITEGKRRMAAFVTFV